MTFAVNTLTQRAMGPACEATVTLDASELNDGDYAGLCFLIGTYGLIALTKESRQAYLVVLARDSEDESIFGNLVDDRPATEVLLSRPRRMETDRARSSHDLQAGSLHGMPNRLVYVLDPRDRRHLQIYNFRIITSILRGC
ncbi:hypothetical protein [Cohnella yongneupensis]|uniref:Beta-xylosidase C-terminal Concanavalin A-like domain-containing protein n=1 Tax=Cohnella yongneupensis TaxID=425006 RepID=A0ABW0QU42_9BACL